VRGCLSVLLAAALFVLGAAWFGGPTLAGAIVERSLAGAGFSGTGTTVAVSADPPLALLGGHADRVVIQSSKASVGGVDADRLTVTLIDVDLVARRFARVDGQLDGVVLHNADGTAVEASSIGLVGRSDAAAATVRIAAATIDAMARAAVRREVGVSVAAVRLVAPDWIVFTAGGLQVEGRLVVDGAGSLGVAVAALGSGTIELVQPGGPLRLKSIRIEAGDLVLAGTYDLTGLTG